MLDHRNASRSGHILTIEDPIEFLFKHKKSIVNQRELGMDTLDWNNALKNAMRQAPDCILIGEIRDREPCRPAIAYAQTGHLCLGTLHANNSYHALNRIINFFPLESRTSLYLDLRSACARSSRSAWSKAGRQADPDQRSAAKRATSPNWSSAAKSGDQGSDGTVAGPGSQTFEQDLFRLYKEATITLDEALANSDSPTNLSG